MSLVADPFPEDERIVVAEVMVHLEQLDRRPVADVGDLAEAWMEVHQCDRAVVDSLDPAAREAYLEVVHGRRVRLRSSPWLDRGSLRTGVAHLRVCLHRRLMVLHLVLDDSSIGGG